MDAPSWSLVDCSRVTDDLSALCEMTAAGAAELTDVHLLSESVYT